MMQRGNRKSAMRVIRGEVRKKNHWTLSPDYYDAPIPRMVVVDRKRPGEGFRHVLNKSDVYRFLALLPDWDRLAIGLNAVVLGVGDDGTDGWHSSLGVVTVCAWKAGLWREVEACYYEAHRGIFERLGVVSKPMDDGQYLCKFDEAAVRGYQLLHILLHELGHHQDRMTTRLQRRVSRGESFAEAYAFEHEALIWDRYHREFR